MRIASVVVNSVSAVPCRSSVGTRMRLTSASPGPRDSNHARSSADSLPVVVPEMKADPMCGSSRPLAWPAAYSTDDQPPLTVSSL